MPHMACASILCLIWHLPVNIVHALYGMCQYFMPYMALACVSVCALYGICQYIMPYMAFASILCLIWLLPVFLFVPYMACASILCLTWHLPVNLVHALYGMCQYFMP